MCFSEQFIEMAGVSRPEGTYLRSLYGQEMHIPEVYEKHKCG